MRKEYTMDNLQSTGILMSTLWSQSGILDLGDNTTITYNEYCPTINNVHCVTGCTNTAAAQILYYYIEKKGLNLKLTLSTEDEYISSRKDDKLTINIKADGSTPGTLSFSAINAHLKNFALKSAEDAAALLYACGVVQEATYGTDATSTTYNEDLFRRAGLKSFNFVYTEWDQYYYWLDNKGKLSDAAFEVLIENLLAGQVIGTAYPGHALVIDGYDAQTDKFHINFGWGNSSSTTWYSREEMRAQNYREFCFDMMVSTQKQITVTDADLYGVGTMLRAFELANGIQGENEVVFEESINGKLLELKNRILLQEEIEVENFNMDLCITATTTSWGIGWRGDENSSGEFENFNGSIIVNTTKQTNAAFYFYDAESLEFEANNALIFAGNYSSGAKNVLNSLKRSQTLEIEVDSSIQDAAEDSYSFFGSNGDDEIELNDHTISVGNIYLQNGNDSLSVTNNSHVYGYISSTGHLSVTIDSTSSISGYLYNSAEFLLLLDSMPEDHALFSIPNGWDLSSNATEITVDITNACVGTYLLFEAPADTARALQNLTLTVTGEQFSDYTLSCQKTSTSKYADLLWEDNMLKLDVKTDFNPPDAPLVSADITVLTNKDVTVSAEFAADSVKNEYKLNNGEWEIYTAGIKFSSNGTVVFRSTDAAGNTSQTSYTVTNIDKIAPTKPVAVADITTLTNQDVAVSAIFAKDSVKNEYRLNDGTWQTYSGNVKLSSNGTVYFRSIDAAGNVSEIARYEVTNIDKDAPGKPVATADRIETTNLDVIVTAEFAADSVKNEYKVNSGSWQEYSGGIKFSTNGTVFFRSTDTAGNISEITRYEVANIDKTAPQTPAVSVDITDATNRDVTVTALFAEDSVKNEYKLENGNWQIYSGSIKFSENGTVFFRSTDAAGNISEIARYDVANIDKTAPDIPEFQSCEITGNRAKLKWTPVEDSGISGSLEYELRYGTQQELSGSGEKVTSTQKTLSDLTYGTYYYQIRAVDKCGNASEWSAVQSFDYLPKNPENLQSSTEYLRWSRSANTDNYLVEYSTDHFSHILRLSVPQTELSILGLPAGEYEWRVQGASNQKIKGDPIVQLQVPAEPQVWTAQEDDIQDIFFITPCGIWEFGYRAEYQGSASVSETVKLKGKNRIADVFSGSNDANILVLTDDTNGDALFVDDMFTVLGNQARLSKIDEIRAGDGNDLIDFTSRQFDYDGDGVKIYGGLGDDIIWSNNGANTISGDAGNDRIIGGTGNDTIIGGTGDDRLNGGGGDDIFCFGGNWGKDVVEQLPAGKVTLWFEDNSGSWDEKTLTYTQGSNSVTVKGTSEITLKFGMNESLPVGAFRDFASEKIFEEKDKGLLA